MESATPEVDKPSIERILSKAEGYLALSISFIDNHLRFCYN
jgi:hypothetical protein